MTTFLKLGGSLITDKNQSEIVNGKILKQCAEEIYEARKTNDKLKLIIGHGAGSFGHKFASEFQTKSGVVGEEQWRGFCLVQDAMLRLNLSVRRALTNIPTVSFFPHDFLLFDNGKLLQSGADDERRCCFTRPIQMALDANVVPLVCGDPVFDETIGGSICSTENLFSALVEHIAPSVILFAGNKDGVLDADGRVIRRITRDTFDDVQQFIGASENAIDTTGGMRTKVLESLHIADKFKCQVLIFNGIVPGRMQKALLDPENVLGTLISSC